MSRLNYIFLQGIVTKPPRITKNSDGSLKGMCAIRVLRNNERPYGINTDYVEHDYPIIKSSDIAILKKMEKWKTTDVIFIKGMYRTEYTRKVHICKHCGHRNLQQGTINTINPVFVQTVASYRTQEDAIKFLTGCTEISNIAFLQGTVAQEPQSYTLRHTTNDKIAGTVSVQFPLYIGRKKFIEGSSIDDKSDFPFIKCFGENAVTASKRLRVNSEITVDGFVQARVAKRTSVCEACGQEYEWTDCVMEVIPYSVELNNNCITDKEIAEMQEKENEKIRSSHKSSNS